MAVDVDQSSFFAYPDPDANPDPALQNCGVTSNFVQKNTLGRVSGDMTPSALKIGFLLPFEIKFVYFIFILYNYNY